MGPVGSVPLISALGLKSAPFESGAANTTVSAASKRNSRLFCPSAGAQMVQAQAPGPTSQRKSKRKKLVIAGISLAIFQTFF
jgi:hypothetical protein